MNEKKSLIIYFKESIYRENKEHRGCFYVVRSANLQIPGIIVKKFDEKNNALWFNIDCTFDFRKSSIVLIYSPDYSIGIPRGVIKRFFRK